MASFRYENKLWKEGKRFIAGVDEVGRGPLAGPIVAAAVVFPQKVKIKGLADSKTLTAKSREKLYSEIKRKALAIGIATLSHRCIDRLNIGRANLLVMKRAIEKLPLMPDYLLIDGERIKIDLPVTQRGILRGDGRSASIAAASIIAKVTRDQMMLRYHKKYPEYGFDSHKGYGTKMHLLKLSKCGPCPIHRRSFSPVLANPEPA